MALDAQLVRLAVGLAGVFSAELAVEFAVGLAKALVVGPLRASLKHSFYNVLCDSSWLALYSYVVGVVGLKCNDRNRELLYLHNELAASCFALWIAPDSIVLCERPASVEIEDNKLLGFTWQKEK